MYIKKLVLKGFKSFAKETEIPFSNAMNVIVGPNGSGKSNITDSICFVLGRLGIKSMRASRAANLIFTGNKTYKPANEASIKMIFDNSDKTFTLPEKEVVIERIVRKNGQGIYKINHATKTRQEVLELLAQAGVDPYGFNIILQGEIDSIIKMHSEDRRKIIEEVAGISIYELRKEKSLRELEKTDEKLKQVQTILRERTTYMKNLEKERQQALRYKQLQEMAERCKVSILNKKILEKKKQAEKIQEEIDKKLEIKNKEQKKIQSIQNEIEKLNQDIENINKSIESATGIEQEKLHQEITEKKSELTGLEIRLENFKNQLKNLEERNTQLPKDINILIEEIKNLEKETPKAKFSLEEFKKEIFNIAKKISQIIPLITDEKIIEKLNQHKNIISFEEPEKAIKTIQNIIDLIEKNNKEKKTHFLELEKLNKKINQLIESEISEDTRSIALEISIKQQEILKLEEIIKTNKKQISELKSDVSNFEEEIDEKSEQVEDNEEKEKELREKFKKLFEKRSSLHDLLRKIEADLLKKQSELAFNDSDLNNLKIDKARIDAECETLAIDFEPYKNVKLITLSIAELENKLERVSTALETIGSVNLRALEVYDELKKEYEAVYEKVEKLEKEKLEILKIIEEIDKKKKKTFMKTLNSVNELFSRNFLQLSTKGHAFLDIENKEDPFAGGLDIIIKIAKGKYFDVSSLSGGEKALVALSLIFAIQEYKPYSFYILDEVDAALDKRNSERLAILIKKYMKTGQYIIVTHNDAVISESTILYGVSMQDGISKILSLEV